jgi:hypothetical protein
VAGSSSDFRGSQISRFSWFRVRVRVRVRARDRVRDRVRVRVKVRVRVRVRAAPLTCEARRSAAFPVGLGLG